MAQESSARIVSIGSGRDIDHAAAEQAVRDLLDALAVDTTQESLQDTPARVARAFTDFLKPQPFRLTTFPNDENYDELIIARNIRFHSLCEHHLLPFVGYAHVAYLPKSRILGLSKLARLVDMFAHSLQVQERLTQQIANWLQDNLDPKGVGVILEAEHMCMALRGVEKPGSTTVTSALLGCVRNDPRTRDEFLRLARNEQ